MPRRTKAQAQETRDRLLDAAELLFASNGVSRTALGDIAAAAQATRGAVYWHFKDKADLFNAMMERVTLPMESALSESGHASAQDDPLDSLWRLRAAYLNALRKTAQDAQTRRVFDIASHKVELVDELQGVRQRHLKGRDECVRVSRAVLQQAAAGAGIRLPIPAKTAAHGLLALIDGLIRGWLLDPAAYPLESTGRQALDAYLQGLGFRMDGAQARRPRAAVPSNAGADAARPAPSGSQKPERSRTRTG